MSTFSPLIDRELRTPKSSARPKGQKITRVIAHHHATTGNGGVQRLTASSDEASANYIIMTTGELIGSVPEGRRAWTSGSAAADNPSITVEIQNSTGGPEWRVSDAAIATFVRLVADIADRHGWGKIGASHVRGHREFQATACPGPYLWARMSRIRSDAQKARGGSGSGSSGSGSSGSSGSGAKSIDTMASEVIAGRHGNGHANRRRSLGVNAATYAKVRAEVNRRAGISTPAGKTIAQMASEVIAGRHGNGHDNRRRSLGVNAATYAKVRAEVNRRL